MGSEKSFRKTIDDTLIEIQSQIGKVDSKILFEQLEKISKYRPLTSLYFNTLAELHFAEKNYDEVFSTLNGKEHWWYPSEYASQSAEIFSKTFEKKGDILHSHQYRNLSCYISDLQLDQNTNMQLLLDSLNQINQLQKQFVSSNEIPTSVRDMFILYTELWRFVEASVMLGIEAKYLESKNIGYNMLNITNEYKVFEPNIGYFIEQITDANGKPFLLIADSSNDIAVYKNLAKALTLLGRKVTLVSGTIVAEVEEPINMYDTVEISLDNKEIADGYELVRPIEVRCKGQILGDNAILVINSILENTDDKYMNLITTTSIFDDLSDSDIFNMRVQCLSPYRGEYYSEFLVFGYIGEYTSYINRIYNINYIEELSQKSECEFSIVIPARNSAYTLQYTLQTCLEQRGMTDSDYEIVISDNSDIGNKDIFNLVQNINDKKIKYFHTPRNLHLTRSFEFAFSKARGEFIIPIGSDDAILPWGLETLRKCMAEYPDDDVFAWDRGFFQWSESKNSGQAGKFVIPECYKKGIYNIKECNCEQLLNKLIKSNGYNLYGIPLLYINSGFRRRYLNRILKQTGRLLDGHAQDIYMGILNLIINNRYISIRYPLTIAGMADSSLGAKSLSLKIDNTSLLKNQNELIICNGFGVPVSGRKKFEPFEIDTSILFGEIFRLMGNNNLVSFLVSILEKHDWYSTFKDIISKYNQANYNYFMCINVMRHNAYILNNQLGKWFDQNLYKNSIDEVYELIDNKNIEDVYFTGFDRGLTLDARKFGVTNIYQATQLFMNITNL